MWIPNVIKEISRKLRQDMTESEWILWEKLRAKRLKYKFYRQKPIFVFQENSWLDRYIIADFYFPEIKLIIELDWSVHNIDEIYLLDLEKERLLKNRWFKVIRFKNSEIYNDLNYVLEKIKKYCNSYKT